jgi:hypothetical protein
MASLDSLPIVDPNAKDPLLEYTTAQSVLKVSQINTLLAQHLGSKWKYVIAYMGIFLFGVMVLIVYGISSENPTISAGLGHLKALCMAVLLSGVVVILWITFLPYKNKTVFGVVPYPTVREMIPPDSSQCGRAPTKCDPQIYSKRCDKICTQPDGIESSGGKKISNNYECVKPEHPRVYYLGTQLDPNQNYCLPKQAKAVMGECDKTYGKVVWTLKDDGTQGWECQCLYPDIFGGPKCNQQMVCNIVGSTENNKAMKKLGQGKLVDNKASGLKADADKYGRFTYVLSDEVAVNSSLPNDKVTVPRFYLDDWNTTNPPMNASPPTSPYEMIPDPRDPSKKIPRFNCYCPGGYTTFDGDPFVCHNDICLNGGSANRPNASEVGFFDQRSKQCKCDGQSTVKTNINGSCYATSAGDICQPHPETQYCTYGWATTTNKVYSTTDGKTIVYQGPTDSVRLMVAVYMDGMNLTTSSTGTKKYLCGSTYNFKPGMVSQYCFVDVTSVVTTDALKSKFYDLTNIDKEHSNVLGWIFDTIVAFPIKNLSDSSVNSPVLTGSYLSGARACDLDVINTFAGNGRTGSKGVARACHSFYFRRNGIKGEVPCEDSLSKTGSDFRPICADGLDTCSGVECVIDLSRADPLDPNIRYKGWGYKCRCDTSSSSIERTFNGIGCSTSIKQGTLVPNLFDGSYQNIENSIKNKVLYEAEPGLYVGSSDPRFKKMWDAYKDKPSYYSDDVCGSLSKVAGYSYEKSDGLEGGFSMWHENPLCSGGYQTSWYYGKYTPSISKCDANKASLSARFSKCGKLKYSDG